MSDQSVDCMKYYSNLIRDEGFQKFESTRDQIEYILTEVQPLADFREHVYRVADTYRSEHVKSSTKSKQFRSNGLNYFRNGDYLSAHSLFIKAVLSAPFPLQYDNQNNELSLSYASKSMAEFQLKDHQSSLLSAENSLEFHETNEMLLHRIHCLRILKRYKESLELIDQLIQKRQNCIDMNKNELSIENLIAIRNYVISQISEQKNTFDFSQQTDKEFMPYMNQNMNKDSNEIVTNLWLHPNCDLKFNERKGRHFMAKQFIPKDTIVLIEKPLNACFYEDFRLKVCLNCNKLIGTDVWPCIGCDEVVFCSKNCFKEAYTEFHEYECCFVGLLCSYGQNFSHTYRIMSRVGLKTVKECEEQNTDIDFKRYIISVNDISEVDRERLKQIKLDTEYQRFHSMTHNNDRYDGLSNAFDSFRVIEMSLLFDYTKQLDFDIEEDIQSFVTFANIIMKNFRRVTTNVFSWHEIVDKSEGLMIGQPSNKCMKKSDTPEKTRIGSCFCTVSSLFNHSCEFNVYWSFKNGIMSYKTVKDISAGQEICITYIASTSVPLIERQQKLRNNYFFDCNCSACLRETKIVLCIRCQQCSGPVVFTEPYLKEMKRKICCLECGNEFQSPEHTMNRITETSNLFNQMVKNLDLNHDVSTSLRVAKQSLDILIDLVYNKSQPLKLYIRELFGLLVYYNNSSEAIEYFKYFDIALESEDIESADVLYDMILLTDCYYEYLNDNKVIDTNHWLTCFRLYFKLIELLKKQKNLLKQSPEKQFEILEIRSAIKDKKKEFKTLSKSYESLIN